MDREEKLTGQIDRLGKAADRLRLYQSQRLDRRAGVKTEQLRRLAAQAIDYARQLEQTLQEELQEK